MVGNPKVMLIAKVNFRIPRENEAARRRTLRVRRPDVGCLMVEVSFGSQGGPCDPSTKNDAGGTPAP